MPKRSQAQIHLERALRKQIEQHLESIRTIVTLWEDDCRASSDELQQDRTMTIPITADGVQVDEIRFRWHPGFQIARPDFSR